MERFLQDLELYLAWCEKHNQNPIHHTVTISKSGISGPTQYSVVVQSVQEPGVGPQEPDSTPGPK